MSDWLQLAFGSLTWHVDPAWREPLFDAAGLRFAEWDRSGALVRLKEASHRSIYRVHVGGQSIYLKHYPIYDARAYLRQWLRPAKALGELRCIQGLHERGVPTLRPLAVGLAPRGESYLITLGLDTTLPLNAFIEERLPTLSPGERVAWRGRLIPELARLIARMHDQGVMHPDLHAGNILVELREGVSPAVYLIDLHAVRLGRPLDWPASRDNLVMFTRWFMERASRGDRRRFWRHYCRCREGWQLGREKERDRARELESTTWKSLLGFYIGREKRCLGTGRYFYRAAASGCRAWASRRLPPDVLAALLNDPEAPFRRPECRILKASSSATVGEFELVVNGVARPFIYKQFHGKRWGISLGRLFRSTPAYRSWSNAFRFEDRGLPTPRALALIHRKRVGLVRDAFLLMEKAEHTRELQEHFAALDALPGSNRLRRRRALIDAVARLLRRLHRHRFAHVDLKAPNLLVTQTDEAADPKLLFVDLVGVARKRQVSRRRRALDLARLHVSFHDEPRLSRTDKLRFLRIYLHWALRGKRGWKWWWRQIAQRTQAKVSRNRRLGRVIT